MIRAEVNVVTDFNNLAPLLSAAGVLVVGVLGYFVNRRNAAAQKESSAAAAWQGFAQELRGEIETLKRDMQELRDRLAVAEATAEAARQREDELRRELEGVFVWIESGMKPPVPQRPTSLRKDK